MYFRDHNPPHFHAEYGEYEASIAINDFSILDGDLPNRVFSYVIEWAVSHKAELMKDWDDMHESDSFTKIAPLV